MLPAVKDDPEYKSIVEKHQDDLRDDEDMATTMTMEQTMGHARKTIHSQDQKTRSRVADINMPSVLGGLRP